MKLNDIFPSKYVKATDLNGKEPTVVISEAKMETLGKDEKLVLYFQGKEKGLVVNRTNADRIAFLYGDDTDSWAGKEIILYTEMVNFQGKATQAIRVKPPTKKGQAAKSGPTPKHIAIDLEPLDEPDDEIPEF